MPLPIALAHRLAKRLAEVRKGERRRLPAAGRQDAGDGPLPGRRPVEIEKVLISTQHADGIDAESLIKPDLWEHVLEPVLPDRSSTTRPSCASNFLVNPTGRFVIGGPMGDAA